jgi:predicted amidophosphoribosyltransferase
MSDLACCDFCGRDTPNKSRICRACISGVRKHTAPTDDAYECRLEGREADVEYAVRQAVENMTQ